MNWLNPILILLAALLAVFFESAFAGYSNLLLAKVDLLPMLMVYAALTHGLFTVVTLAFAGGLLFDSLSANPFGASVLPLLVIGLFIYYNRGLLLRQNTNAQFFFGLFASAAAPLMTLLVILALGESPLLGWGSIWQWIAMTVVGGMLTPMCFRFFDRVKRSLNYEPVAEQNSFHPDREIKRGRY
ncbi:MAG: Rod shape-determining protein MreD [Verrucomicrobiales bacterium]|nr:Rod shape-determining protein MreD [Verrucomicrobiales bacterium]